MCFGKRPKTFPSGSGPISIRKIVPISNLINISVLLHKYTKEFKYNIKLAIPVILGMLGHTFVQFADNIMVGQLGTAELAAVSLGNSFVFIAMSLAIGFSTAITPLVAEADGAGNRVDGKNALKHGILLCLGLGTVLFCVILFARPLMYRMEQPPEVVELAMPYLNLVALSLVPLSVFQALKQFSDGLSQTKYPMYATIIANISNITLNYLLIFGAFGMPKLGIVGAAIGTLVSRILMVIYLWAILRFKRKFQDYVAQMQWLTLDRKVIRKIVRLGFPSALQMFFEVVIFTAAIWLSGVLGKNAQAANQIALNLSSMTFMFGTGFGVTAMIRVGNQRGLRHYVDLQRIARSIFLLTFLLQTLFAILFLVGRYWFPTLYLDDHSAVNMADNIEVIAIAAQLLFVAAFFQISDGIQVAVLGALRGMQDVVVPTWITMVAYWIIGFPICYYLGLHTSWGSTGIWIGLLVGLTASAIMLYLRFEFLTKRLIAGSRALV